MQSPSQALPLGTWNTIISQRHNSNKPVKDYYYLGSIQDRIKRLDSCGFSWKKEAFMAMILRINQSVEPMVYPQDFMRKNLHAIQEPSFDTRSSLCELPVEIIDRIIEYLHLISPQEAGAIKKQRVNRLLRATGGGDRIYYHCCLPPEEPILNSLQTFSLVNKNFYERCRPWLWKTIKFPTTMPAPIIVWEDLLFKHGTLVRFLSAELYDTSKNPCGQPLRNGFYYDNTDIQVKAGPNPSSAGALRYIRQGLSLRSVAYLLKQCPNLRAFELKFNALETMNCLHDGLLRMITYISNLTQLRDLALINTHKAKSLEEFILSILEQLPLLESFTCARLTTTSMDGAQSFGRHLSQLCYLTELRLYQVSAVNESWCLYPWSGKIILLELHATSELIPSKACRIIHHIAPNLLSLDIDFCESFGLDEDLNSNEIEEYDPNWTDRDRFLLPLLTEFMFEAWPIDLLPNFQDCKALCRLLYSYTALEDVQSLYKLVCTSTWPKLNLIDLYNNLDWTIHQPQGPEIERYVELLRKYCELKNIDLRIHQTDVFEASSEC